MENSTRENRMKPKLKPLLINRQIDFESVTKTAPVMAIIETNESPIESAVHDLRVAIEQEVKKNNVHRTYSEGKSEKPQRRASIKEAPIPHKFRPRNKTVSGESNQSNDSGLTNFAGSRFFSRTYSRNPDVMTPLSSFPSEEWRRLFDRYDVENNGRVDGKIPVKDFEKILEENVLWVEKVPADVRANIIALTDMDGDGYVSQEEFLQLANGRNIPGFNRRRRRALRELLKQTVEFIVPYKYQYQNQYSCFPPPFFMICISLLQIVIFGYNSYVGGIGLNGPVFHCSHLIFDPDKRHQVWRYLTYMLIHSGLFHAIFNILIQLILGLPLEMVNGWWRVMLVYCSGVLAGSLWTSVLKPDKFLAGASGGVYALITAHLAIVIMNYREMALPWCRVLIVIIVAVSDIAVYFYGIYVSNSSQVPIGYAAHISGAIAGLLVGIVCLKNLRWEQHEKYIWALSACIFGLLIGSTIVYSVAFPSHFTGIRHIRNITCVSNDII